MWPKDYFLRIVVKLCSQRLRKELSKTTATTLEKLVGRCWKTTYLSFLEVLFSGAMILSWRVRPHKTGNDELHNTFLVLAPQFSKIGLVKVWIRPWRCICLCWRVLVRQGDIERPHGLFSQHRADLGCSFTWISLSLTGASCASAAGMAPAWQNPQQLCSACMGAGGPAPCHPSWLVSMIHPSLTNPSK